MKTIVSLFLLLSPFFAHADNCKSTAIEAAEWLYLANAGIIQGGDPITTFISSQDIYSNQTVATVEVEDGNDEGESWTVVIKVRMVKGSCHIKQVTESEIN